MNDKTKTEKQVIITFPESAMNLAHLEPMQFFKDGQPMKDADGNPIYRYNKDGTVMESVWIKLPSPQYRDDDFIMPVDTNGIDRAKRGAHIKLPISMIHTSKYNHNQKYVYIPENFNISIYIHGHSDEIGNYDNPEKYICRNAHELAAAFGMKKKNEAVINKNQQEKQNDNMKKKEIDISNYYNTIKAGYGDEFLPFADFWIDKIMEDYFKEEERTDDLLDKIFDTVMNAKHIDEETKIYKFYNETIQKNDYRFSQSYKIHEETENFIIKGIIDIDAVELYNAQAVKWLYEDLVDYRNYGLEKEPIRACEDKYEKEINTTLIEEDEEEMEL